MAVALEPEEVDVAPTRACLVERECSGSEIPAASESGFNELISFMESNDIRPSGPPRAIYTAYGPAGVRFTLAVPIGDAPESLVGDDAVRVARLDGGRTLRFKHVGPYDRLAQTYGAITEWLKAHGRMESDADWEKFMPMWEEYRDDPQRTPPAALVTYIHLPARG